MKVELNSWKDRFNRECKYKSSIIVYGNINDLVLDEKKGVYYLIVHYKKMDRRLRYAVSVLSQYSESWIIGERLEKIIKEHGRLVFKARAIQKLAEIEQVK